MKFLIVFFSFFAFSSVSLGDEPLSSPSSITAKCSGWFRANEPVGNPIDTQITVTSSKFGGSSEGYLYLSEPFQVDGRRHIVELNNFATYIKLSYMTGYKNSGGTLRSYTEVSKPDLGKTVTVLLHHTGENEGFEIGMNIECEVTRTR